MNLIQWVSILQVSIWIKTLKDQLQEDFEKQESLISQNKIITSHQKTIS